MLFSLSLIFDFFFWKFFLCCGKCSLNNLQAEEDALLFQRLVVAEDNGQFEGRVRPYIDQVRLVIDFPYSLIWLDVCRMLGNKEF